MKLLEMLVALGLVLVLFLFAPIKTNHTLESALNSLSAHIKMLQILSLSDDSAYVHLESARDMFSVYPAISAQKLLLHHPNALWQMQFHLGKVYTTHSYSIYVDTPRSASSTHFDSRPMAGDIIFKNMDRKCLSAYNNTNTAIECRNNALSQVRLGEHFGIENIFIESDSFCKERESARIYFDRYGAPHCGKIPTPLRSAFKITLVKNANTKSLCILPQSGALVEC